MRRIVYHLLTGFVAMSQVGQEIECKLLHSSCLLLRLLILSATMEHHVRACCHRLALALGAGQGEFEIRSAVQQGTTGVAGSASNSDGRRRG